MKNKLIALFSVVAMAMFISIANPSIANAASGRVTCSDGRVVGMWIEVGDGGTSGWATLTPTASPTVKSWSYDTQGKWWRAHVGCGGTPQHWKVKLYSNWTNKSDRATVNCNEISYIQNCRVG